MTSTMLTNDNIKKLSEYHNKSEDHYCLEQYKLQQHLKLTQLPDEEKASISKFSRENLNVLQSNTEEEFNKKSFKWKIINRHTILNICTIILAMTCIFFEILKFPKVLENSRNIEMLKNDLEALQRQFYEENFSNEFRAFEQQLYGADNNNDDDDDDDDDDYDYDYNQDNEESNNNNNNNNSSVNKKENESSSTDSLNLRRKRYINSKEEGMPKNASPYPHDTRNDMKYKYLENTTETSTIKSGVMVADQMKKSSTPRVSNKRNLHTVRHIFAAHYGADSSLFSDDDEHTGNGRFRHSEGIFKAWRPSDWMNNFEMDRHFSLANDGRLTVRETGLYFVYAQIHYLDEHDENGFHVLVNGRPILQCMVYSPGNNHKSRSCFSAQVIFLQNNDRIVLKDIGISRYTLFQKDKSFFGLFKIGEMKHSQIYPL